MLSTGGEMANEPAAQGGGLVDTVTSVSPPTRRVIAVMEYLARDPLRPASLTDVGLGAGINRATCLAILSELVRAGWLVRDPTTKAYGLGPSVLHLGAAADDALQHVHLARQALDELHKRFGFGCGVATTRNGYVEVVAFVGDAGDAGRRRVPFGAPFGPAFVAWADDAAQEEWFRRSRSPLDDDDRAWYATVFASMRQRLYGVDRLSDAAIRLRRVLTEVAEDPAAEWIQPEIDDMLHKLGNRVQVVRELVPDARFPVNLFYAPVFGADSRPVLNLSVHPVRVMSFEELSSLSSHLTAAAAEITGRCGGRIPQVQTNADTSHNVRGRQ
jgi:DNA-binding IclR family transcriptional regulator